MRFQLPMVPLIICVCLAGAALLAFTTGQNMLRNYHLRQDKQQLNAQILELERDHEQLQGIHDYLQSDEYIEDVARRTLGYVKPGETLVVVSGEDSPDASPTAEATSTAPWWKALFGLDAATPVAPSPLNP